MAPFHAFIAEHILYTLQNIYIFYMIESWPCTTSFHASRAQKNKYILSSFPIVHLRVAGVIKADGTFESLTVEHIFQLLRVHSSS